MTQTPRKIAHLHVVCYRWGTRYGPEYVNRLQSMINRYLPVPHTFHCITDSQDGLRKDIVTHPLPDFQITGIWRKLMTFQKGFLGLEDGEYVASFDLDVVVVDSLAFILDKPEEPLYIGRNWSRHCEKAPASGTLYRLRVGALAHVWERFIADPEAAVNGYHGKNRDIGEQNWLGANVERFVFFPEGKVVSFKRHCGAKGHSLCGSFGERLGLTTAAFGIAKPPAGAAVVSFHGDPLPPDVMHGRYGRWRRAPFVAEHWHE